MATLACWRYPWSFAPGLAPGQDYAGYIQWQAAPFRQANAAAILTAVPASPNDRLTILDTSIRGLGAFMSAEFTMRNTGLYTVTNWTIFYSIVEP